MYMCRRTAARARKTSVEISAFIVVRYGSTIEPFSEQVGRAQWLATDYVQCPHPAIMPINHRDSVLSGNKLLCRSDTLLYMQRSHCIIVVWRSGAFRATQPSRGSTLHLILVLTDTFGNFPVCDVKLLSAPLPAPVQLDPARARTARR